MPTLFLRTARRWTESPITRQEAFRIAEETGGPAAVVSQYQALRKHFPKVDAIADVAWNHAILKVRDQARAGKFAAAVDSATAYGPILASDERRAELGGLAYDLWAKSLIDAKDWKGAIAKYKEGLKTYPRQPLLQHNGPAAVVTWAQPAIDAKKWREAVRIYNLGLDAFPAIAP